MQDQEFISRKLSPAQALTAQVLPDLKKHETKQLSPSPPVSWYLVCEGISLLLFLYVYKDNEDIYNYANWKKAARDPRCANNNALTTLNIHKVLQRRAGEGGSHFSSYWCQEGMKFLTCPSVGERPKLLDCIKSWQHILRKHWILHTVSLWLPPQPNWCSPGLSFVKSPA